MTTAWGGQPPNLNGATQTHWGAPSIGMLGSVMKAAWTSGEHGPSPLANDLLSDNLEYLWYIETQPNSGGVLTGTELGTVELAVTADGSYSWTYRLVESGVLLTPPATVLVNIGTAPGTMTASVAALGPFTLTGTAAVIASLLSPTTVTATAAVIGNLVLSGVAAVTAAVGSGSTLFPPNPSQLRSVDYGQQPAPHAWAKTSAEILDFSCTFKAALADVNDSHAASFVTVPSPLVSLASKWDDTTGRLSVLLAGGLPGFYQLQFVVVTAQGRQFVKPLQLVVNT